MKLREVLPELLVNFVELLLCQRGFSEGYFYPGWFLERFIFRDESGGWYQAYSCLERQTAPPQAEEFIVADFRPLPARKTIAKAIEMCAFSRSLYFEPDRRINISYDKVCCHFVDGWVHYCGRF